MRQFYHIAILSVQKHLRLTLCVLCCTMLMDAKSQIGDFRNELALGVSGGYTINNVGFTPEIPQNSLGGYTAGVALRYTCEKYFKSICALVTEVNISQCGWKQSILDEKDQPVINTSTGMAEEYQRTITYIQIPFMARLGWGREYHGLQFYVQAGPQIGFYLNDKIKANYAYDQRNQDSRLGVLKEAPQEVMPIERKFDYGITAGAGLDYSIPRIGHFLLEGRYYYGLADIYGNSKKDFFGRSNNSTIQIKLTYLTDLIRSNNPKIK